MKHTKCQTCGHPAVTLSADGRLATHGTPWGMHWICPGSGVRVGRDWLAGIARCEICGETHRSEHH